MVANELIAWFIANKQAFNRFNFEHIKLDNLSKYEKPPRFSFDLLVVLGVDQLSLRSSMLAYEGTMLRGRIFPQITLHINLGSHSPVKGETRNKFM